MKTNFLIGLIILFVGITLNGCEEQTIINQEQKDLAFQMEDILLLSLDDDAAEIHLEGTMPTDGSTRQTDEPNERANLSLYKFDEENRRQPDAQYAGLHYN